MPNSDESAATKKLYLVSQVSNLGYDTWDSFVVVAQTAEEARSYHPTFDSSQPCDVYGQGGEDNRYNWSRWREGPGRSWCADPSLAEAEELAVYTGDKPCGTQIIASFNAG